MKERKRFMMAMTECIRSRETLPAQSAPVGSWQLGRSREQIWKLSERLPQAARRPGSKVVASLNVELPANGTHAVRIVHKTVMLVC